MTATQLLLEEATHVCTECSMTAQQSERPNPIHTCASASAALSPSLEQSEMGQPWSRLEKGQAPLEMWR